VTVSFSTGAMVAQLGASFAVSSILLKYSRTAESQADIMGTQILYDSGYDPRAMAQFFETIEAQQKGSGPVEFFSNHPSPENRIERANQEVNALGGVQRSTSSSTPARNGWHAPCCWPAMASRIIPKRCSPKIPQETLAEMVGTTRSRINVFMNKFRTMGFIKYNGGLQIDASLLSVILHD